MSIETKYRFYKKLAVVVLISFLFELFAPTAALALTGGPTQPEFSSFEPVATTNMVNEFTGDFTYNLPVLNIPGANGGGYALSLAYHSGASPEEEASWVGYGWTLNPGSITRNKRGFPDDWNAANVKYWNKTPMSQTVSIGGGITGEIFSFDIPGSLDGSTRYNNYQGFGYNAGIGLKFGQGVVSLGYNISDGEGSFSLSVNPAAILNYKTKAAREADKKNAGKYLQENKKDENLKSSTKTLKEKIKKAGRYAEKMGIGKFNLVGSNYGIASFSGAEHPTQTTEYTGQSYSLVLGVLPNPTGLEAGPDVSAFGSYTYQKNLPVDAPNVLTSYGYMYSEGASDASSMMDYYVEKESTYNKRDRFLGVPFNNADNYTITGEGIGGGFRMYNKKAGHFRPNEKVSETDFFEIGFDIGAGQNFGGGLHAKGVGGHTLTVKKWDISSGEASFADPTDSTEDEAVHFRFNNDLGGYVEFGSSEKEQADITYTSTVAGSKATNVSVSGIGNPTLNNGVRSGRSSYIGYTTNEKILEQTSSGVRYRAYSKYKPTADLVYREDTKLSKQVGELSVVNEDGQRYTYGLPVFSRMEKNLQYDVAGLAGANIQNNYLAFKDVTVEADIKSKVGEERDEPYATAYLLTEITGPDYVDRTHNGPTEDDFGGYTRFSYSRVHGGANKSTSTSDDWYKWRIPYRGLLYNRGSLSDPKDDMGSVIEGEKEIYYLDSIITKTHFAVFDVSVRADGKDAEHSAMLASSSSSAAGAKTLRRLDKIRLYAKQPDGTGKLIKTINFRYDNSLADGAPNSSSGKLTLKKLWFEYEGVVSAKITPYQFEYAYPTSAQANYPTPYDSFENYKNYPDTTQNPDYSPFDLDAWGNYQSGGASRFADMKEHVNQNPSSSFDPAAWQLKVIKLPSGGEIHVQYEQDDYSYVQNKYANVLVSLKNASDDSDSKYYLKLSDLGIDDSGSPDTVARIQELRKIIQTRFIDMEKRMYFKFLYKLAEDITPELSHCDADYVTGYAHVKKVGIDPTNGLWVELGKGLIDHDKPRKVCVDFVKTQRAGKLTPGICDASEDKVITGNEPETIIMNFLAYATDFQMPADTKFCLNVNFGLSYLRIPAVDAKKGGGVRVKRLLMYDKGIETGYPNLYGSEYSYEIYDDSRGKVISSGVATNEPASIREENVLVDFIERFKQHFVGKVISGRDKKQAEGPLGESILPAPSVGYSRIVVKNIHSGKTNPGYSVKEFYTAKDYPFQADMTDIDDSHKDYLPVPGGLINLFYNNVWLSQGFSFTLNNMHGQRKSAATFSGSPSDSQPALVSKEEHFYFEPGESLPVMTGLGVTEDKPLGKEMEMIFESRKVQDINNDTKMESDGDAGIFYAAVIPFISAFPSYTYTESELYSHATTKITTYPAVVKSVKKYQDGIIHETENIAFSPETGQPIVTRTTDSYHDLSILSGTHNGVYTNYTFPASLKYDNLSQMAKNEKKLVRSGSSSGANMSKIVIDGNTWLSFSAADSGGSVCSAMGNFVAGDLVKLSNGEIYHTGDAAGSRMELHKVSFYSPYSTSTASNVNVEIIRSGRSNRLNEPAGSLTTYGPDAASTITPAYVDTTTSLPRWRLAELLTSAIGDETDTILPEDIPIGLSFTGSDGNCTDSLLKYNQYILIEGNNLNIYERTYIADTNVVGSPGSPHPMVDSLNNYFAKYYGYVLDTAGMNNNYCEISDAFRIQSLAITSPDVDSMIDLQIIDMNADFSNVNNGTYSISDFFTRIYNNNNARTEIDVPASKRYNRTAILARLDSSTIWGRAYTTCNSRDAAQAGNYNSCSFECVASLEEEGICDFIVADSLDTIPVHKAFGSFVETEDGYLAFEGADTNRNCTIDDIRFYYLELPGTPGTPLLVCSHPLQMSGGEGEFAVDTNTFNLVYFAADNNCYAQDVGCISFCSEAYPGSTIKNVVACNSKTYSDDWPYDPSLYYNTPAGNPNVYETGEKGKWRVDGDYVFSKNIRGLLTAYTSSDTNKNYNSGTYELELFNWKTLDANKSNLWYKLNTVRKYSPDGNALEEENILGIKSAAKFGYSQTVPYLVAQNSDYASVMFESFEKTYSGNAYFEDGMENSSVSGTLDSNAFHSGLKSLKLKNSEKGVELASMTATGQLLSKGMLMKVWVKSDLTDLGTGLKAELRDSTGASVLTSAVFSKVAKVGQWTLFEAKLTGLSSVLSADISFLAYLRYEFSEQHTENVWIDDVRVQPLDAQVINYVYDVNTLRLVASFDDQHFGLFYQYNGEGKLVRKLIETERGMKTVQETQYNTPVVSR